MGHFVELMDGRKKLQKWDAFRVDVGLSDEWIGLAVRYPVVYIVGPIWCMNLNMYATSQVVEMSIKKDEYTIKY